MSRQRLWPMMPASSVASDAPPNSGCVARSNADGSTDVHGGVHSGLTPLRASWISAMCRARWHDAHYASTLESPYVLRESFRRRCGARRPLIAVVAVVAVVGDDR